MSKKKVTRITLYCKCGRKEQPVASFTNEDSDVNAKIEALKAHNTQQKLREGAPFPSFRVKQETIKQKTEESNG